jgi:hypothetical protein
MNRRVLYPIFERPVRLERVSAGLWVRTATETTSPVTDDEFFRSAELFQEPMARSEKARETNSSEIVLRGSDAPRSE